MSIEEIENLAGTIALELIEAPRALPVLDENDYKRIRYYVQHFYKRRNNVTKPLSMLGRLVSKNKGGFDSRQRVAVTEILGENGWQRYEDGQCVGQGEHGLGFLPVVHIQNIAQPYSYEGISDVEPLIPLQDELNTRLSDRANRITFQSFKMYLGKGIDGFVNQPVAPGRMWCTDNMDAHIDEFGGDSYTPSEDRHIKEIRLAMDKTSSVTPVAAGVIEGKVGNLTSAVALRLTLMGTLSKTERKRYTYGRGIEQICSMALEMLDKANVFKTSPADRKVELVFASPLPENTLEKLQEAQIKKELGVPDAQVLGELGYEVDVQESR